MHVRKLGAWVGALFCAAASAQNVLLNTNADSATEGAIAPAFVATAGGGIIGSSVFLDYDTVVAFSSFLADAQNPSASTIKSIATGLSVNHAPYAVVVSPFPGAVTGGPTPDVGYYGTLEAGGMILALPLAKARVGAYPAGTPPGVLTSYVSSSNSGDGGSGPAIEFGISASYLGLNTTSDSADAGSLAGFFAALKYEHPTWTFGDVKAALRQCAGNWSAGYNVAAFGYGSINWTCANALSGTGAGVMWLEPPGMAITNFGYYAMVVLYPFRQARRVKEVVYIGGTWPAASSGNELTAAQVAAAGGTLIYTSNGTDVTPTFSYVPAASGSATFYALTLDSSGNASRVESFVGQAESFTVSPQCQK